MNADDPQRDAEEFGFEDHPNPAVYPLAGLTRNIIGAATEVRRELGPGFLEKVYEAALITESALRGIGSKPQAAIQVPYRDEQVGVYFADLLVESQVICEIKVADALVDIHEAQLLHYLRATGKQVGLLLNFGTRRLEVKRAVRSR